jgi:hypothetical protein
VIVNTSSAVPIRINASIERRKKRRLCRGRVFLWQAGVLLSLSNRWLIDVMWLNEDCYIAVGDNRADIFSVQFERSLDKKLAFRFWVIESFQKVG